MLRRLSFVALVSLLLGPGSASGGTIVTVAPPAPPLSHDQRELLEQISAWRIVFHQELTRTASGFGAGGDLFGPPFSSFPTPLPGTVTGWIDRGTQTETFDATFLVSGSPGCPARNVCGPDYSIPATASLAFRFHSEELINIADCVELPDGTLGPGRQSSVRDVDINGTLQLDGSPGRRFFGGFFHIDHGANPPRAEAFLFDTPQFSGTDTGTYAGCLAGRMILRSTSDSASVEFTTEDAQVYVEDGQLVIRGSTEVTSDEPGCQFASFLSCLDPSHLIPTQLHQRTTVEARPLYLVSGTVRDGTSADRHSHPLKGVRVELLQEGAVKAKVATDRDGKFLLAAPEAGDYELRAWLQDAEDGASSNGPNFPIFEVRHGDDATEPVWVSVDGISVITDQDVAEKDIDFSSSAGVSESNVPGHEDHLDDMANIFWRTRQFVDWAKEALGVTAFSSPGNPIPVKIDAFSQLEESQRGANSMSYLEGSAFLSIAPGRSLFFTRDAEGDPSPENGEWHEFGHHLFWAHVKDASRCNGVNHGGYKNPDTCDSLNEGLASFLATLAWQGIEGGTDSRYAGIAELESDGLYPWSRVEGKQAEDLAIAALLWDLFDTNPDPQETKVRKRDATGHVRYTFIDEMSIPVRDLWSIIDSVDPGDTTVAGLMLALLDSPLVPEEDKETSIDLDGDGVDDVSRLEVPFLMHGFYAINPNFESDSWLHRHYWVGQQPIGWTDHVDADGNGPEVALIERRHIPEIPRSYVRLNVVDTAGRPLSGATSVWTLAYPELTDRIERPLDRGLGNLEYLELPPHYRGRLPEGDPLPPCDIEERYTVTVTIAAERNGVRSPESFRFDNCQYLHALEAATGDHALELTFTFPEDPGTNLPPAAEAGADQVVSAGEDCAGRVSLDGSASSDPDGDPLAFTWTGSFGTAQGAIVTVPLPLGSHTVSLTVGDGRGGTAADTVEVAVEDTTAPILSGIAEPLQVECAGSATPVSLPAAVATDNCGLVTVTSDAPATFPLGSTTVTFHAVDPAGNGATASTAVVVVDTTPPSIDSLSALPAVLWPPNHRMVPVSIKASATDLCSAAAQCKIVSVSSNEPVDGPGYGHTAPDWEVVGDLRVNLRAERSGKGNGRSYSVAVQCTDASGNGRTRTVAVTVPHDNVNASN